MDTRSLIKHLKTVKSSDTEWQFNSDFNVSTSGNTNSLFTVEESYLDLTLNANGKAELYFHAYIWVSVIESLCSRTSKDFE